MFASMRKVSAFVAPIRRSFGTDTSPFKQFRVYFPIVGVAVGLTALGFQITVLYPWHEILTDEFTALEVVTKRIEATQIKLDEKLDLVLQQEVEVKLKENRILEIESRILDRIEEMIHRERVKKMQDK